MKTDIRTRLMIYFSLIVTVILLVLCVCIYWFSSNYRRSEFYSRLEYKAFGTVRLLLDVKEVDSTLLKIIDKNTPQVMVNEVVAVFDNRDMKIYCSLDRDTLEVSKKVLDQVRLEKMVRFNLGKNEAIGILHSQGIYRYVVIASAFDLYGKNKLNYLKWILLAGFLLSIIMTVFSSRFYATQALRPISDIVDEVDKISVESLNRRVGVGNHTDEIARLAMTFNRMLGRLESAFAMQSSFVSNASHELRTPLTSITGQIDVALMKPRSGEEYKAILESVLEDIRNLNTLSNGLLDLVKVSSDVSAIILQPLRIDDIIWETRTELIMRKPHYTVIIHFDEPIEEEKELTVRGNTQLLKSAILNLMDNGCKFSINHAVKIHLYSSAGNIVLKFTDEGIGIAAEDMENILHPFFRAGNVQSIPGSGLGLPLAYRIIRLHGGTLTIDSVAGKGTTITVSLPVMG